MALKQRLFTLHGSTRDDSHHWLTLLRSGGLEIAEVTSRDLGLSHGFNDLAHVFRGADNFAGKKGFVSAYPTFVTTGDGLSMRWQIVMLSGHIAQQCDVPAADLHEPEHYDHGHFARVIFNWGWDQKRRYEPGFPNFHRGGEGANLKFGAVFVRRNCGVHLSVQSAQLGNPIAEDLAACYRAAHQYAVKAGYASAFPNGHGARAPVPRLVHSFHHDFGVRHMVEHEGWRVARIEQFPPQTDGQGIVHYAATFVLEKEE